LEDRTNASAKGPSNAKKKMTREKKGEPILGRKHMEKKGQT